MHSPISFTLRFVKKTLKRDIELRDGLGVFSFAVSLYSCIEEIAKSITFLAVFWETAVAACPLEILASKRRYP